MNNEQRKQIIEKLTSGQLKDLENLSKINSGKKKVLSTFLDFMMHYSCNENQLDDSIEVEIVGDLKDMLLGIEAEEKSKIQ